ncbi:phenylacetate--CoA ligase family protein [bacterium]|nr:phenylacetate--CoA ligase family protein [bacterium]
MDWRWLAWQVLGGDEGRQAAAAYDLLLETQWWTPAQLENYQASRLAQILDYARQSIPFYQSLPLDSEVITIDQLPLIGRVDLKRLGHSLMNLEAGGTMHRVTSSGSTGEPVSIVYDGSSAAWRHAAALRGDCWGSQLGPTARQVALWGNSRDLKSRHPLLEAASSLYRNRFLLDCFVLDDAKVRALHQRIRRLRPGIIYGYVTALSAFVSISRRLGLRAPAVSKVIPTAEYCSELQRLDFEEYFGCPVLGRYGSREIGSMAHQCEQGNWHWHSENFLLEVQLTDGSFARHGCGRAVCTTLSNRVMPLLRYDIGDVVDATAVPCNCGRGLPAFRGIEGRVAEHITSPDGRLISSLAFTNFLRRLSLKRFRIVQDSADHLEVLLQGLAPEDEALLSGLHKDFDGVLLGLMKVDLKLVERIEPLPSGKNPHVVNLTLRS